MKMRHKVILVCILLLISWQGGIMSGVAEEPVAGPGRKLSAKEINDLEGKANRGDIEAIQCLFDYYVFEDSGKALIWARKGAKLGDAKLQYLLGGMIVDSADSKAREEGISAMKKSAEQNYYLAQTSLADWYEEGRGVQKDLRLAEKWFSKAAMQGSTTSMFELVRLMTGRAKDMTALSEAYGWTILMLKRTTSKWSQPFVDKIYLAQKEILAKAKGSGVDEKEFISSSEAWAKKKDVSIPMTDPTSVGEPPCKYWKK